jgi:hypothetical protein
LAGFLDSVAVFVRQLRGALVCLSLVRQRPFPADKSTRLWAISGTTAIYRRGEYGIWGRERIPDEMEIRGGGKKLGRYVGEAARALA